MNPRVDQVVTDMGKILIVDKDMKVIEMLELLFNALEQPFEFVYTQNNVVRIHNNEQVDAIIINPELPLIDPRALIDEVEVVSLELNRPRAPMIFLYSDESLLRRYELSDIPNSQFLEKPVTMEQVYGAIDSLGLTKLKMNNSKQHIEEKISKLGSFIELSESWMAELKDRLLKS